MKIPAIQIAPNLYRVPTKGDFINSFLFLENDGSITLVDTGLKGAPKRILDALGFLNRDISEVKRILLTHSHDDHASGAAELIEIIGKPQVLAHEADAQFFESGENPPRDLSHFAGLFFRFMPAGGFTPFKVTQRVKGGETLPIAGGLKVIHTPGHTPGHISLLHNESETLITGDSIFNFGFRRAWSLSAFCTNFEESKRTARVFAEVDFKNAAFTHGPHIMHSGKSALGKFLKSKN